MQAQQLRLIAINVVGGAAVLGSYAWGLLAQPEAMGALWGSVPESARSLYTSNMYAAALGYFLFTPYIVFGLLSRPSASPSPTLLTWLYVAILVPSALWLPLTYLMVTGPGTLLWWLIRGVLGLTALGSAGLLVSLLRMDADQRGRGHRWAVLGLLPFCLQTVVLDAIVWPLYFPA